MQMPLGLIKAVRGFSQAHGDTPRISRGSPELRERSERKAKEPPPTHANGIKRSGHAVSEGIGAGESIDEKAPADPRERH